MFIIVFLTCLIHMFQAQIVVDLPLLRPYSTAASTGPARDMSSLHTFCTAVNCLNNNLFKQGLQPGSASWDFTVDQSGNYINDACTQQWYGIGCDSSNRVISIDLSLASLAGTISPALSNIDYLRRLDLSDNSLSGPVPESLGSMTTLQKLDFSTNPGIAGELELCQLSLQTAPKLTIDVRFTAVTCYKSCWTVQPTKIDSILFVDTRYVCSACLLKP
jgi:hypothetical protein